jgi:hypothetical protein
MNEIKAVRVRDIPAWIARRGITVWCGGPGLEVPGYRTVWRTQGPAADGKGTIHLTAVMPRSVVTVSDRFVDDLLRPWAEKWFVEVGKC